MKAGHPSAVPIQGGTDVLVALNFDRARPDTLLNLNEVAELQRAAMAGSEIVVHHRAVAGALERLGRVAPDVPRAAGDEDGARLSGQWKSR